VLFEVPLSCEFGDDGLVVVPGVVGFVPPVEVEPGDPIEPGVPLLDDEVVPLVLEELPVLPEMPVLPEIGGVPTGLVPPTVPDVPMLPEVPVLEDVLPEVPAVLEEELEPSRGCAAASSVVERERFALRPCAFLDRFAFLWIDDELALVSSLVFPANAASSLVVEVDESDVVAFEVSPVASEEVCAVDEACGTACCAAAPVANANAPTRAMNMIFICMLSCSPSSFRWGRGMPSGNRAGRGVARRTPARPDYV